MKYAQDITELIGGTPLIQIKNSVDSGSNLLLGKLENFNPSSSVKDRTALGIITDAEDQGLLQKGSTIIEATSGNTGISLSFIAASRGYKLIIVMPQSTHNDREKLFKLFGTEVILTPPREGMSGAITKAREINNTIKNSFLIDQFCNEQNSKIHEETTAQEIYNDTNGKVSTVIAGVGTGGTISGIALGLKKHNPAIKIIAVEPKLSAVLSGKNHGCHTIQGIGAGFIPEILKTDLIDEIIQVSDDAASHWTIKLIREEGILAGLSSGAALYASYQYIKRFNPKNETIVTIFPDTGERYISFLVHGN